MGKNPSEEQLKALLEFITFENLRKLDTLKMVGNFYNPEMVFFNEGKIGYWKKYFSEEMSKKVDDMLEKNLTYSKHPIQFEPRKKD